MDDQRRRVRGTNDPINPAFSEGRWQDALRRMRGRIEEGLPLVLENGGVTGDRETSASWGMCSKDPVQWPESDDHVFPADFERKQRVVPRDPPKGARCPMDLAEPDITGAVLGHYGCFYRCLLFQGAGSHEPEKIRLHVLNRYDVEIGDQPHITGDPSVSEPWNVDPIAE